MANEREINGNPNTSDLKELTKDQKKARLARVLERGVVGDRLQVDLPPDIYGEWVPNDKVEIYRMQSLGFDVDTKYAKTRALHDSGDSTAVVGDVIFMTCDRETKDIIDEIRREQFEKNNNPKKQKEDRETATSLDVHGLPPIIESTQNSVRKAEIEAALNKKE